MANRKHIYSRICVCNFIYELRAQQKFAELPYSINFTLEPARECDHCISYSVYNRIKMRKSSALLRFRAIAQNLPFDSFWSAITLARS